MLRTCTILGLVLLLVGGLAYAWVRNETRTADSETAIPVTEDELQSGKYLEKYGRWYQLTPEEQNQLALEIDKERQTKTPEQLAAEQNQRLIVDRDKLAAGEMNPGDIADFLYGANWEAKVEQYREDKEQVQIVQTASTVCLLIGATLTGGCILIGILWSIARVFRALGQRRLERRRTVDAEPSELTEILHHEESDEDLTDAPDASAEEPDVPDSPEPLPEAGPAQFAESQDDEETERFIIPRSHPDKPGGRRSLATEPRVDESAMDESAVDESAVDEDPMAVLLSDEPTPDPEWSPDMEWSTPSGDTEVPESTQQRQRFTPRPRVAILGEDAPPSFAESTTEASVAVAEDPLQNQADSLQEQIAEFKEVAQSVQQATREQSAPLSNTLKELAQQVSAIREYAACQQGRVEKLQDGYDWNIIRTFCLRVIRCIDNLETRITKLGEEDETAMHLDEVKDELLFALESSGIEQFSPEIHSPYRGQEKLAEAVKQKESTEEPDQIGKIAKVVRPGYRYIIDEESCKIVRTAQVKLFG